MAWFTNPASGGDTTAIPQVISNDGDYFPSAADAGKHFYFVSVGALIIPTDSTINYPIGTTFVVVSGDNNAGIVCQNWNDMAIWGAGYNQTDAGAGWYITSRSMATVIKIDTNTWMVSGATLSLGW
jgi:hypothetical protein